MVLGDHVEVLQGTVGDEASTLLYVDHMPRPIEVRGQQARIQTSCRSRVPGEDLELVSQTDQNEEQDQESDGETVPRTRGAGSRFA